MKTDKIDIQKSSSEREILSDVKELFDKKEREKKLHIKQNRERKLPKRKTCPAPAVKKFAPRNGRGARQKAIKPLGTLLRGTRERRKKVRQGLFSAIKDDVYTARVLDLRLNFGP